MEICFELGCTFYAFAFSKLFDSGPLGPEIQMDMKNESQSGHQRKKMIYMAYTSVRFIGGHGEIPVE